MNRPTVTCLMPAKNEACILPATLTILSQYCDRIIIADQMSTDGSREVYARFPKVIVIDNPRDGHSNEVRWDLLRKAREYGKNNLIMCLDADEYIPPTLFEKFITSRDFKTGESFRFPWIQLWKSSKQYNATGAWYRNYQRAAWVDDGVTDYDRTVIINDHTSRVPQGFLRNCIRIDDTPIIHLQWTFWDKVQYKQAWYRCVELVRSPGTHVSINASYSHSLDSSPRALTPTPDEWVREYGGAASDEPVETNWHRREILALFDLHGIEFFEPLEIWHIDDLRQEFVTRTGRAPVSIQESRIKRSIRNLTRRVKKMIQY